MQYKMAEKIQAHNDEFQAWWITRNSQQVHHCEFKKNEKRQNLKSNQRKKADNLQKNAS